MCIWGGWEDHMVNLQRRRSGEWPAKLGPFSFVLLSDKRERGWSWFSKLSVRKWWAMLYFSLRLETFKLKKKKSVSSDFQANKQKREGNVPSILGTQIYFFFFIFLPPKIVCTLAEWTEELGNYSIVPLKNEVTATQVYQNQGFAVLFLAWLVFPAAFSPHHVSRVHQWALFLLRAVQLEKKLQGWGVPLESLSPPFSFSICLALDSL